MKKRRILSFSIILLLFILFLILKSDKINSLNDISKLNKIQIYDSNSSLIYEEVNGHSNTYISLKEISPLLIEATITLEDKNFYSHSGFDLYQIASSFIYNISHKNKRGASTITQQYIKNLYLSNKQTLKRKILELYYSIRLEKLYTKDEILEGYFNTIYFGNNIYGIYDASKFYFNKEPAILNENEIALILALLKKPSLYNPLINYNLSNEKKDSILTILYNKKIITKSSYLKYYKTPIEINGTISIPNTPLLYFKDQCINAFKSLNLKIGFNNTVKIYTRYNSMVNDTITNYLNNTNILCDLSSIVLDNEGYVISILGGKNYHTTTFNIAVSGNRDIGSTIKPLLYLNALDYNLTPLSTWKSEKTVFKINNNEFEIKNYNDIYEDKDITMLYALATSDNIYACKTHLYIGMDKLVNTLKLFNIKASKQLSLALGSVSMSLLKLTEIYNTLSNLGSNTNIKYIERIESTKSTLYKNEVNYKRILNKTNTFLINDLLTNTFDTALSSKLSVTGSSIARYINYPLAGKSGLTDYDSYMVGFNPLYTVSVWSGYIDNSPLTSSYDKIHSKRLFTNIFNTLMKNLDPIWYKIPNDVTSIYTDPSGLNTGYKKRVYKAKIK